MKNCVYRVPDSCGSQTCVACLYSTEWISYTTRLYSTALRARASCFVLRGNVVLSFVYLRHHTRLRTRLFGPSWIHAITQYSEQCFVPHGFTTSCNIQNNVVLFLMDSRHHTIFRTTLICSSLLHDIKRSSEQQLCAITWRHHAIVGTTLCYLSWLHDITLLSEQRCFILRNFTTWYDHNINILCFMASVHLVLFRTTLVCPLLSHDFTQSSEQRRFVLYCLTTSHNRQNNVGLFCTDSLQTHWVQQGLPLPCWASQLQHTV